MVGAIKDTSYAENEWMLEFLLTIALANIQPLAD